MIKFVAFGVILGFAVCSPAAVPTPEPPASDPRALHLSADFTRDGRPEDISIEFLESDIRKPFRWVVSIKTDDGKVIYSRRYDDEQFDDIVSDPEHVGGCTNYDECKRKYYFTDVPRRIGDCLKSSTSPWLSEKRLVPRLEEAAGFDLEKMKLSASQTSTAISEMKATLSAPGHVSLCVPFGPDFTEPPMIWVEAIQEFVTYYRP